MAYQVLARKWRPQDFTGLIGQEPIVTALRNALRDARIAQAYLFSGIRGVGKTTAARLLAKALNCENGPAADPCNDCTSCAEITSGSSLDVLEIDAATYSKVEQVRELTESLRYAPAKARRKVVVLDEVHRLSRQAFDALLKIVEEPPEHLTFIFATTEIEAVPATILSRCQEFHFRRVPAAELVAHLAKICTAEDITASDTALRLIARAGEGSVRDSVALLDQLATFGGGSVPEEDAARLLGGLDTALFEKSLVAILAGDGPTLSSLVTEIEDRGYDPRSAFAQFLDYLRDALHLSLGGQGALDRVDLPKDESARLAKLANAAGSENLLRLLHLLLSSEPLMRRVEAPALALEVSWLRAAELPKLVALEKAVAGGSTGSKAVDVNPLGGAPPPTQTTAEAPNERSSSAVDPPATSETDAASPAAITPDTEPDRRPGAQPETTLDTTQSATPSDPTKTPTLPGEENSTASTDTSQLSQAAQHPSVQAVLTVFGGSVETVEAAASRKATSPSEVPEPG